ncbi:hypothetical protein ASN18_0793 [Candidatus Magnetominusculus xianensis]|uniref:Uncharacterized protein n=1 Tax=Candidatus Magnetominusculus xianensis TaxID=1748249 RepID=A0ABR5SHP3_9BACT|nr:hypothetical protein ASN18_0793 [Candidatus Magnetominusculus xianensis]
MVDFYSQVMLENISLDDKGMEKYTDRRVLGYR